ncbi:pentatricopeptide repeat-containing protein At3g62470, mitochondrial-like [Pistacia vera]|uniref:pentatricopeptide repeat-containing protein At3g62470, mitochondrial-like n=1 Tax=Pistacia vera TaxID=55513 RepID=UPI0012638A49|nr:pentatricopeptide repeat-containing protein At3g62470, mitochondrial-like [Pistacia vera]XP_031288002.1 pentatricopeptide repeat-containing protein At3g62470, mitochondrial-like [Pistacia vera]
MNFFLRKSSRISILLGRCIDFQTHYSTPSNSYGHLFSNTELLSHDQRQRRRAIRPRRGKAWLSHGSSLSLSRLFHSSSYCGRRRSHCQVSFVLPHPPSLRTVQETLLIKSMSVSISSLNNQNLPAKVLDLNYKGFSSVTYDSSDFDDDVESDVNVESDNESVSVKCSVDPKEVDRVCKVIDQLFALDRNMEAVLDECGINISHDLVIEVLERFRHARKPAFRFFCWAGEKPGFAHDSRTYNAMMNILGKTRQFETMVSMLEEMGTKNRLTVDTFKIAMNAFAAAKERKKAVAIFELMKKYKYKADVDTINFLLDSLGRAKLVKEAQLLFEKLKDRFTPNLMTYTVLLNGWCRVKNLMEAGRVWNDMIDKGFKPDIVVHNVMLEGLLRSKKRSDSIKLFEIMKAKGPLPNVCSYTIMIRDFCKQRKMKEAVEYFDAMLESGCQPDAAVYTCLITGFGHQKRMDLVYDLLQEMQEKGYPPDGRTYNALIKLMTSQRMPDDAVRIYKKMIQSGTEPTIHTCNMIMKSYFQTRNYEMGHAVWNEMLRKGCCPDDNSYTVFIGGLISQGRAAEACKFLEEMIEKGMKAPQLDYKKFAADLSRAGKPDILDELAQKMKFSGKFAASNVFASWAEMMKNKRRGSY